MQSKDLYFKNECSPSGVRLIIAALLVVSIHKSRGRPIVLVVPGSVLKHPGDGREVLDRLGDVGDVPDRPGDDGEVAEKSPSSLARSRRPQTTAVLTCRSSFGQIIP